MGGTTRELQAECSHHGHILALYVRCRGDFVVVGDLMKSMSLLMYKVGGREERMRGGLDERGRKEGRGVVQMELLSTALQAASPLKDV